MQHRSRSRPIRFESLESRYTPALVVDLGTIELLPDTAGQFVELRVESTDSVNDPLVTGVNLLAQIGDGRGPLPEPVFSAVEFTGGIWDAFPATSTGGVVDDAPQFVQAGVVFNQTGQAVAADGVLARLTVSTVGIDQGTFGFQLSNVEVGEDSHFVGTGGVMLPIELVSGQMEVLPPNHPPSAILLSNNQVEEFLAGESVGQVTVEDPDVGDAHDLTVSDDRFEIIDGLLKLKNDQFLRHELASQVSLRITAQDSGTPPRSLFVDFPLDVLANPFPWQNSSDRLDVNRDGLVAPNDVLIVINDLNARGARSLPVPPALPLAPPPFIDVSGDNLVAPGDALLVVNFLNRQGGEAYAAGEGEAAGEPRWYAPPEFAADVLSPLSDPHAWPALRQRLLRQATTWKSDQIFGDAGNSGVCRAYIQQARSERPGAVVRTELPATRLATGASPVDASDRDATEWDAADGHAQNWITGDWDRRDWDREDWDGELE